MFACCLGARLAEGAGAATQETASSAPTAAADAAATLPATPIIPARTTEQSGTKQDVPSASPVAKATMEGLLVAAPKDSSPPSDASGGSAETPPADSQNVIRMRPLTIEGIRPLPKFEERDLMSERDFIAAAERRYLTDLDRFLNAINLFSFSSDPRAPNGSKESRALAAYDEEQRQKDLMYFRIQAAAADAAGDTKSGAEIRRLGAEVTRRPADWGYRPRR